MSTITQNTIIPICCVCGLIRENATSPKAESWVNKGMFRRTHGKDPAAYRLTHTYCPTCYSEFMSRIAAA